jgi:hypothetical protein
MSISRLRSAPVFLFFLATRLAAQPTPDLPSSKGEVASALEAIEHKYGRDAVKLQSHLLNYALQGGSDLEANVVIRGNDSRDGKTYMAVVLESGIVYNDTGESAGHYPERVWVDIVDPTLRQFEAIEVPTDGVALHISYRHAAYEDRTDLYRKMRENAPPADVVSFHLLSSDVVDMVHARISSSELLRRSSALLNGQPVAIELSAEPGAPPTRGVDVLPH